MKFICVLAVLAVHPGGAVVAETVAPAPEPVVEQTREDWFAALADPQGADWRRAEKRLRAAFATSGSASLDLLLRQGRAALERGETRAALHHYGTVTELDPGLAEGWHGLATALFAREAFGPGFDALGRALAAEPRHFDALFLLGMMLAEIGEEDAALEALRRAAALHPHMPDLGDAIDMLARAREGQDI